MVTSNEHDRSEAAVMLARRIADLAEGLDRKSANGLISLIARIAQIECTERRNIEESEFLRAQVRQSQAVCGKP